MSDHQTWGGPPPSYYDPPDDRHCPECSAADGQACEIDSPAFEMRLFDHREGCETCAAGDCLSLLTGPEPCKFVPQPCDDSEHKTCGYHARVMRETYWSREDE